MTKKGVVLTRVEVHGQAIATGGLALHLQTVNVDGTESVDR